jgi:hypothetical protein
MKPIKFCVAESGEDFLPEPSVSVESAMLTT